MGKEMTSVYAGGLMYEYSLEENGFGIVKIPGAESQNVEEQEEFNKFAKALAAYPAPSGNGGASPSSHGVACPTKDENWLIDTTLLPAIPEAAKPVSDFYLIGMSRG